MKFRIPNPPDIKGKLEARKERKAAERKQKFEERVARITEWHETTAWLPTRLTEDDDTGSHWAWGGKIMQKAKLKNVKHIGGLTDKIVTEETWTRYTSQEYFKKRLNGEIKDESNFANMKQDVTDAFIQGAGSVSMKVSGANDDILVYDGDGQLIQKRYVTFEELSEHAKRPATNSDKG